MKLRAVKDLFLRWLPSWWVMPAISVVIMGGLIGMVIIAHSAQATTVAPSVRGVSTATVRYTVDPKTITTPTVAAGDLLLMVFVSDYESVTDMSLPSGFTELSLRDYGFNSDHMMVGTKVATASEPSSYTYVAPSGADTRVDLFSIKDADTTNAPVIVSTQTPTSATTHTAPNVTPQGTNDLLISSVALMSAPTTPGATTWTPPPGMTELTDAQTSTILTMTSASQVLTGGASGTKTFTATAGTAVPGMAFSMAINGIGDTPGAFPQPVAPSVRNVTSATVPYTVADPKTVAAPGSVAGDLLVMVFLTDYGTIDDMVLPAGFTAQYYLDRGLNKNHMIVATKIATSSEPSSYSYGANSGADTRVDMLSIKDADTAAPLIGNGVVPTTTVNYQIAPQVNAQGTNDLLIASANTVSYPVPGPTTWIPPFGMTELTDAQTTNLSQTTAVEQIYTAGTTSAKSFTMVPQTVVPGDAFLIDVKGKAGNTAQIVPDGNISNAWPTGDYSAIDEGPTTTADYLGNSSSTDGQVATFSMQNVANIAQARSITLNVCTYSATNALGGTMDTIGSNMIINGVAQAVQTITPSYSTTSTCKWSRQTLTGTWTQTDIDSLQMSFKRNLAGTGSSSAKADDVRIVSAYATVVYDSPPNVAQESYRWFTNADSSTPGSPLAAANTSIGAPAAGTPIRLRMNLGATTGDANDTTTYKLRYQLKSGSCSTNPALYSDLSTTTPVKFYDNPSVVSGSLYTATANDPSRSGVTPVSQTYQEANPFAITTSVLKSQDGLWDFALTTDASATQGSSYCVMVTNTDNTALGGGYVSIAELTIPAPTLDQSSYRFYQNDDATTPGAAIAAQNAPAIVDAGATYRLRQLIAQTAGSTASTQGFKLQFGQKLTTCSAATYVDATTSVMNDNASVADEAAISTSGNDPAPSSGTVIAQTYSENAATTLLSALQTGNNALWDFALKSDKSLDGKTYCFRIVKSDGTALTTYSQYPEVSFAVATPSIDQQVRGGQTVVNGVKHSLTW